MDKTIIINGRELYFKFKPHIISIINSDLLEGLITANPETVTTEIVNFIKKEYYNLFGKNLAITDDSIFIEIIGHIYADKFADAVKRISNIGFVDALAEKIIHHCEVIDIGEKEHDENRFIWDKLPHFKTTIIKLLPVKHN